jgi:hypothetical protein
MDRSHIAISSCSVKIRPGRTCGARATRDGLCGMHLRLSRTVPRADPRIEAARRADAARCARSDEKLALQTSQELAAALLTCARNALRIARNSSP